jgi:hypothetical protein
LTNQLEKQTPMLFQEFIYLYSHPQPIFIFAFFLKRVVSKKPSDKSSPLKFLMNPCPTEGTELKKVSLHDEIITRQSAGTKTRSQQEV